MSVAAPAPEAEVPAPASTGGLALRVLATALAAAPAGVVGVLAAAAWRGQGLPAWIPATGIPSRVVSLGEAAVAALAGYVVVLLGLALITAPRRVRPDPASMELGAEPEPPAVAGFLVNGWATPREAVQGTLIDLAARHQVAFVQAEPGHTVLHLNQGADRSRLASYETRVLDHVRSLATGGVVPAEALATWPAHDSDRWFAAFSREVVAEARHRGLSRPRWPGWALAVLAACAAVPVILAALAVAAAPSLDPKHPGNLGVAVIGGVIAWALLAFLPPGFARQQRDTPRGRRAAAHWLAVRRYLHADQVFPTLPPAAVTIWNRYLAYGASVGVAEAAVRQLPFGAEDPRRAWSSFGGRWRTVGISYPGWRPGWGARPRGLLGRGLRRVILGLLPWAVLLIIDRLTPPRGQPDTVAIVALIPAQYRWAVALLVVYTALLVGWGLLYVGLALADLRQRETVTGRVLRVQEVKRNSDGNTVVVSYWVAVDDGTQPHVDAWRARPVLMGGIREGDDVTAVITPHCRHVRSLSVTNPSAG
jgi:hypothetical protein